MREPRRAFGSHAASRVRDSGVGGLESKFGRGLGSPGARERNELVLLAPGVQARLVFRGTQQLGYIGSRSKNWKMEGDKRILIAYHLLESRTGAN
jgi:hypothetical protein